MRGCALRPPRPPGCSAPRRASPAFSGRRTGGGSLASHSAAQSESADLETCRVRPGRDQSAGARLARRGRSNLQTKRVSPPRTDPNHQTITDELTLRADTERENYSEFLPVAEPQQFTPLASRE